MAARPGLTRFEYNSAGYVKVMKSAGVQADLARRAAAVRSAILARYTDRAPDWEVTADVKVGRNRARAVISGVPMRDEIAERILGGALDAAR